MFCGLTVVEFQLAHEGPGDGGLAVVPASHKANYAMPARLSLYEEHREYVKEVHTEAGDAIIFTEALTHGTLVWNGDHQRWSLLYKYSPSFQAHAPGTHQAVVPDYILDMSEQERAMLVDIT
jgi:ectoine hydroxylase-related dioxygenase (phytanoyl-CoA dioxygenase family)